MKWLKEPQRAEALFQDWPETIIWSCLQGVMGHVYGDDAEFPRSAMAVLGDFCFLAGEPLEELLNGEEKLRREGFRILVPQNEKWAELTEEFYGDQVKEGIRYAFRKAFAYARYRDGIEIEIDTEPSHRQKGLASACGAGLILECLKRGLYPSWDAQNAVSAALAGKLGYHFSHTYRIYEVTGSRTEQSSREREIQ